MSRLSKIYAEYIPLKLDIVKALPIPFLTISKATLWIGSNIER
jgi:hypothetical protein